MDITRGPRRSCPGSGLLASVDTESCFQSDEEILPKHPGALLGMLITFRTRSPKCMKWPARFLGLVKAVSHHPLPCEDPQLLPLTPLPT